MNAHPLNHRMGWGLVLAVVLIALAALVASVPRVRTAEAATSDRSEFSDAAAADPFQVQAVRGQTESATTTDASDGSEEAEDSEDSEGDEDDSEEADEPEHLQLTRIQLTSVGDQPAVQLRLTQRAGVKLQYLENPDRLLVKVLNAQLKGKTATLAVDRPPLVRIRAAQHPDGAWVVLDLTQPTRWTVVRVQAGILIKPADASGSVTSESVVVTATSAAGAEYQVVDVAAEDLGDKTRLVVTTDSLARYRLEREAPDRLVLDLHGAGLAWRGGLKRLPIGVLRRVQAIQRREAGQPITRLTLETLQPTSYLVFKDQNQVILEFDNPGTLNRGIVLRGDLKSTVSVDLQNADLVGFLRALAQDAGFDLIFTPGSQTLPADENQVTLSINEQPLESVLDFVLRPRRMAYEVQGNTLRVGLAAEFPTETRVFSLKYGTARSGNLVETLEGAATEGAKDKVVLDESTNRVVITAIGVDMKRMRDIIARLDTSSPVATKTLKLNYTKARKLMPVVRSSLSKAGGVTVNDNENALVVSDVPGNLRAIEGLVRRLDTKAKQIVIEARLVEVNLGNRADLGVNWTAPNAGQAPPAPDGKSVPGTTTGELKTGTVSPGVDLNATLALLESKGLANTLSNPRIATLNNQSATIETSQNIPYHTKSVSQGVVSQAVEYLNLPISLSVTPQLTQDNQVLLDPLTLTVTTVVSTDEPPMTARRSASTQLLVGNNETIALSGMVRDDDKFSEFKFPLLGDLPAVGSLFRSTSTNHRKIELVVFLTPRILD